MRRAVIISCVVIAAVAAIVMTSRLAHAPRKPDSAPPEQSAPARIVCLSPGITETVFALGLGDHVVGVTSHTYYPPEAAGIAQVGDWLATNVEAVVALRPDLVLASSMESSVQDHFKALGLRCLMVKQDKVSDILSSIEHIGAACGAPDAARHVIAGINDRLRLVARAMEGRERPRTLVCAGRDYSSSKLDQVYVAGAESFYSELVDMAGGKNVFENGGFPFPAISGEGIMQLNPDVILDVVPERARLGLEAEALVNAWKALPDVAAVRNGRVYILDEDFISVPGPRVVDALVAIAKKLHPDANL